MEQEKINLGQDYIIAKLKEWLGKALINDKKILKMNARTEAHIVHIFKNIIRKGMIATDANNFLLRCKRSVFSYGKDIYSYLKENKVLPNWSSLVTFHDIDNDMFRYFKGARFNRPMWNLNYGELFEVKYAYGSYEYDIDSVENSLKRLKDNYGNHEIWPILNNYIQDVWLPLEKTKSGEKLYNEGNVLNFMEMIKYYYSQSEFWDKFNAMMDDIITENFSENIFKKIAERKLIAYCAVPDRIKKAQENIHKKRNQIVLKELNLLSDQLLDRYDIDVAVKVGEQDKDIWTMTLKR